MPSRCPHCEVEIEEGARFCGACGRPITATAISQRAAAALPKHSPAAATIKVSPQEPASPGLASSAPSIPFQAAPAAATVISSTPSIAPLSSAPAASAPAQAAPVRPAVGVRPAAQPLENLIGRTLNHRYLVGDKVGEGGFGAVFRGKQIATGREVALKILHPHNVSDETIVARFRREAEACSKLRDPHTVTTYDFDETPDGILYLAMELLRGQSLHQVQKAEGPLGYERVLKILDQVAASLAEAHRNGIVHRDMKPENVFIESRDGEDHVKVLDFGIAKVVSDERQVPALTAVGQTLGTLEFMSPEQLRGQKLDGRSDLYALGMMSYEMLTGTLPFATAKSPIDIINFHMRSEPPAPSKLSDKVTIPAAVDAIILKMVAKDKDKRFADANALREEIARTQRALDSSPDRFEAYRVVAVVGVTIAIVAALLFFLHR
ncbi:MAG TPA: serine/threonine-protein kinase [Polyangia bacterium]|nr:serine/threonine-protein kinase [Polyangia bacterium]